MKTANNIMLRHAELYSVADGARTDVTGGINDDGEWKCDVL